MVASAWLVLVLEEVLEGKEYCRLGAGDGLKLTAVAPRYMGYTGLISDNIIEMDVVTADGSEVKVSQSSNSDLYWGMRGAGHNYGIVTQFKHKIFDYPKGQNTYYVTYFFTGNQLEVFFEQLNRLLDNGNLPKDVNTYTLYLLNPFIDPKVSHQMLFLIPKSFTDCLSTARNLIPTLLLRDSRRSSTIPPTFPRSKAHHRHQHHNRL